MVVCHPKKRPEKQVVIVSAIPSTSDITQKMLLKDSGTRLESQNQVQVGKKLEKRVIFFGDRDAFELELALQQSWID